MDVKRLAKDWCPPAVWRSLRRHVFPGLSDWEYVGAQWPEMDKRADGWDDPSAAAALVANWRRYSEQAAGTGPWAFHSWDATGANPDAYNQLVSFAYCVALASRGEQRLSVLDLGGALGNFALIARAAVPGLTLDYTVKDRRSICAAGRNVNPTVQFVDTDKQAFSRRYDLVVACNALQYSSDWVGALGRLADVAEQWLAILTAPVVVDHPGFVIVQHPQSYGFAADYISWVFNRDELLTQAAQSGFVFEREFLSCGPIYAFGAPEIAKHASFLFRRGHALKGA
jgi:putative methyltransferase (TIGR04325 family)